MTDCDFCGEECDGRLIIREDNGSEIQVCATCMNLYANGDFKKLGKRLKV